MNEPEEPVKAPTWMANIRFYFTQEDIDHMGRRGIDLATYDGVKANAFRVLGATEPPDATMPPPPREQWSGARWRTFKNWIVNGYPFGTSVGQPALFKSMAAVAGRVRRDASTLGAAELDVVRRAFEGMMALPMDDPNSYFAQAATHWLPAPLYCLHHEPRYNPWHRAYLIHFENAMRSIPGCADVTLPYWDITRPVPDFLYQAPFDHYVLPRDIGGGFEAGYTTSRYDARQVADNVAAYGIPGQIQDALGRSVWSQFNSVIIRAHDNGHGAIGDTVRQQDVASYDPIFWFFHANLDRLWWKWQQAVGATTLEGFLSTVRGDTDWVKTPPFNQLPPFSQGVDQTIDLSSFDVGYEHPAGEASPDFVREAFGSVRASELKGLHAAARASVRVKGIDRLKIPGSFTVHLLAGDETVARQAFFQARNPRACSACIKQGIVDVDFEVDLDQLRGAPLRVELEPLWPDAMGKTFPLSTAGEPTINMRLLLE